MKGIKKLIQRFFKNETKLYFATVVISLILNTYLTVNCFLKPDHNIIHAITVVISVTSTILCVYSGMMLLKNKTLENFFESIYNESSKLYFHGFKLSRYLETDVFLRLERWLGYGICYELSALTMILVKNCRTARLCRGDLYDENGTFRTRHSWVELKVPLNGWYVIDLAWRFPGFCRKKDYFRQLNNDNALLVPKWVCTHSEFWNIYFSDIIREAMLHEKTSCILLELSGFGDPDKEYQFEDWIHEANRLRFSDGGRMPIHRGNASDRPISDGIIGDFIKNPRREQPKERSIRLALRTR